MKKINELNGFENVSDNYYVTTCGKVYSSYIKSFMSGDIRNNGYVGLTLRTKDHKPKKVTVHRLVAIAFIENEKDLLTVNHKDFNKENNSVCNLEWLSHKDNVDHFHKNGENTYHRRIAKLKDEEVLEIIEKYKNGGTYKGLAREYGVDSVVITRIIKNLSYQWVKRV